MLFAPSVKLARHRVRGISDRSPQIEPTNPKRELEDPGEGTSGMSRPPAKKIRPGARSPTPEALPVNNKGKKRSITNVLEEDKPSKKRMIDTPKRETKTVVIYNTKFRNTNKSSIFITAGSSQETAGEIWETSQAESDDSVFENNNEPTVVSEPGPSGKRRSRQKRRQTERGRRAQDEKDSGIGSLVDLLDDMVVGDTKPVKPPKPVKPVKPTKHRPKLVKLKSKPLVPAPPKGSDLEQVVERTKNSDKDRRKTMKVAALCSTVVVDGIPDHMLPFFKELHRQCNGALWMRRRRLWGQLADYEEPRNNTTSSAFSSRSTAATSAATTITRTRVSLKPWTEQRKCTESSDDLAAAEGSSLP